MWQIVLLTLAIQAGGVDKPAAERVIFDIQIVEGERLVTAQLALYRFASGEYSLHCRKKPSGMIFQYWANPTDNVLYLPRQKAAFSGASQEAFQLFEGGPRLASEEWLKLLDGKKDIALGRWRLHTDPIWQSLYREEPAMRIMWRERKRQTTDRYSQKIRRPKFAEGTEHRSLTELSTSIVHD